MPMKVDAWLHQQILEQVQDAIVVSDRDGMIRLWNRAAEAMFGYPAGEAVGQSLDIIIPERFREQHWEGYHKVLETGVTRYGTELLAVPGVRKDGERISLEFSISILSDEAGERMGFAAILRDVTERWKEQKALRERLADLEAKAGDQANPPAE
ncbi:MAG: PAS domain S-box protein [Nitrospinae bacterium]|nr:PAS domain S-box protein [Nitrospinota bacterium]